MQPTIVIHRKPIKHFYLRFKKDGSLHVSAPIQASVTAIQKCLDAKKSWILQKQQALLSQHQPQPQQLTNGEQIYYLGQPTTLQFSNEINAHYCANRQQLSIPIAKGANWMQRRNALDKVLRCELQKWLDQFVTQYEPRMQVSVSQSRIKKMKTRWGSCNIVDKRIWLNLALIAYPKGCIEQTVVHEMVHLLEPSHNKRFYQLMTTFMPDWQTYANYLKQQPYLYQ